jgi:hypothetical protein
MKHRMFGSLTLFAILGVLAMFASIAGAEEVSSASNEGTPTTVEASPALEASPMSLGQCEQGTMCIWEANGWEGNFSWFAGQNTGCHWHPGLPNIRSAWNRTGFSVELPGYGNIASGERFSGQGVFTEPLCW